MDAVRDMAECVVRTGFSDLPARAVEATRNDILDTFGTALAGSAAPGCRELVNTLHPAYAGTQASIWVHGHRVPAPEAALANSTMAHALDFDDTHDRACLHAGISVIQIGRAHV